MSLRPSRRRSNVATMHELRRICVIGYEGIQALDLVGPSDAFTSARVEAADGTASCPYEVVVIGLTSKSFTAESGVTFKPTCTLEDAPALDTLIIPGGCGMRTAAVSVPVA